MTAQAQAFTEYSDAEHRYFVDGRELPSVTQILDASGLISSFCKDEEARFRGSKVHELCAVDDVTPLDLRTVPASLRGYVRAWRRYRADAGFMPTLIEHRVDDIKHGFCGRFDRLGIRREQSLLTIIDLKTSKSGAVPDYARLQLAAYALAYDATKVFERIAVALKPDGSYNCRIYPLFNHHADRAEWLGLVKKQKESNGHRNN